MLVSSDQGEPTLGAIIAEQTHTWSGDFEYLRLLSRKGNIDLDGGGCVLLNDLPFSTYYAQPTIGKFYTFAGAHDFHILHPRLEYHRPTEECSVPHSCPSGQAAPGWALPGHGRPDQAIDG